ncbi:ATP-grasp fold amidoligase family protein [Halomonas sp. 11-S5]|uniref:ATP-grasp fold amidoligase family protein n=1 Tax=Halomonas sp. 11-S5 TaxID=2994064 RepID=UPI0024684076|nr:ATP-grasp fold amidoligase family protein [Halomonas sp. 11-S5]
MGMQRRGSQWDYRLLNYWTRLVNRLGVDRSYEQFFRFEKATGFLYTRLKCKVKLDYYPSIRNPRSFNEKSIHRRLFSRNALWPVVTDKLLVRQWLSQNGLDNGLGFLPLMDVIEDAKSYDFSKLEGPLVIKAAWGSGYNLFVDDAEREDWASIRQRLIDWQHQPFKPLNLAWTDTQVRRVFLVERRYSEPGKRMLDDYKFFVFHGRVQLIETIADRENKKVESFFDRDLKAHGEFPGNEVNGRKLDVRVADMVELAECIGRHFDFVRVDFYLHEGDILFGEITQCPANGFGNTLPKAIDFSLGGKWRYEPKASHEAL